MAMAVLMLSACNDETADLVSLSPRNPTTTTSSNHAPAISGSAQTDAVVGVPYSFTPAATDANGDTLAFTITNKPSWATFNSATGALTGTPTVAGTYSNISISVSDGKVATALATYTITVRTNIAGIAALSWAEPTVNADGSPLTDLAGYTIYYGTDSANLDNRVSINSAGTTSYSVAGLNAGATYYFAIASVNKAGISSERLGVVSMTI